MFWANAGFLPLVDLVRHFPFESLLDIAITHFGLNMPTPNPVGY